MLKKTPRSHTVTVTKSSRGLNASYEVYLRHGVRAPPGRPGGGHVTQIRNFVDYACHAHVAGSFKDFTAFVAVPKQKVRALHALVSPVRVLPLGTVSFLGGAHIFESSTWIMSLEEEIIKTQNILQPLVDRPQLKAKVCIGNWKRHERLIVCSSCLNRRSASFMT